LNPGNIPGAGLGAKVNMTVNKSRQNEFSRGFNSLSFLRDFNLGGRADSFNFTAFNQNDAVGERLFPGAINECPANYGYEGWLGVCLFSGRMWWWGLTPGRRGRRQL